MNAVIDNRVLPSTSHLLPRDTLRIEDATDVFEPRGVVVVELGPSDHVEQPGEEVDKLHVGDTK